MEAVSFDSASFFALDLHVTLNHNIIEQAEGLKSFLIGTNPHAMTVCRPVKSDTEMKKAEIFITASFNDFLVLLNPCLLQPVLLPLQHLFLPEIQQHGCRIRA